MPDRRSIRFENEKDSVMEQGFSPSKRDLLVAIVAGCMISFIGFGFVATFGVFLRPMSIDLEWPREIFSLSIAIQVLFWGIAQPVAGMVADRYGAARVLAIGAILAALGFYLRGSMVDPMVFIASGIIVGIGTGACSFPVVIIALGKVVSASQRSLVMGLGTAAASTGMLVAAPLSQFLLVNGGWQAAINVIAAGFLMILPFLYFVGRVSMPSSKSNHMAGVLSAIQLAFNDRSYLLLFFGFFVCGFHVTFIQTHLPAYIVDKGLAVTVGGWSLALIGLFNIAGSFLSGWSGQVLPKKNVLSGIYAARAIVILAFIMTPMSPTSVYVFSAAMGILWLSTVPLTTSLVAQTQGLTYLSTLAGFVFLSHQIGAFIGSWLGGRVFDLYQDYTPVWIASIILGVLAMLIHLPIRETARSLADPQSAG